MVDFDASYQSMQQAANAVIEIKAQLGNVADRHRDLEAKLTRLKGDRLAAAEAEAFGEGLGLTPSRADIEELEMKIAGCDSAREKLDGELTRRQKTLTVVRDEHFKVCREHLKTEVRPDAVAQWHAAMDQVKAAGTRLMAIDHLTCRTLNPGGWPHPNPDDDFGPVASLLRAAQAGCGVNSEVRPTWFRKWTADPDITQLPEMFEHRAKLLADLGNPTR